MINEDLKDAIKFSYIIQYFLDVGSTIFIDEYKNKLLKSLLSYDNNFDALKFLNYSDEELGNFINEFLDDIYSKMTMND